MHLFALIAAVTWSRLATRNSRLGNHSCRDLPIRFSRAKLATSLFLLDARLPIARIAPLATAALRPRLRHVITTRTGVAGNSTSQTVSKHSTSLSLIDSALLRYSRDIAILNVTFDCCCSLRNSLIYCESQRQSRRSGCMTTSSRPAASPFAAPILPPPLSRSEWISSMVD